MLKKIVFSAFLFFLLTPSVLVFSQEKKQEVFIDEAIKKSADYLSGKLGETTVIFDKSAFSGTPKNFSDHIVSLLNTYLNDAGISVTADWDVLKQQRKQVEDAIRKGHIDEGKVNYFDIKAPKWTIYGWITPVSNSKNYDLSILAIDSESGKKFQMLPIRVTMDEQLANLLEDQQWLTQEENRKQEIKMHEASVWKNKWLWPSLMIGITPLPGEPPKLIIDAQLGIALAGPYGVGFDIVFNQRIRSSAKELHTGLFAFSVFPVMLNFRPQFEKFGMEIGLYTGFYYNMPDNVPVSLKYGKSAPFGLVFGGDIGFKAGPGVLFFDARAGFWDAWENNYWKENRVVRFMNFGLGYKIGLINK